MRCPSVFTEQQNRVGGSIAVVVGPLGNDPAPFAGESSKFLIS
jgi:hypothetical protein